MKQFILLCTVVCGTQAALAGYFAEPFLGYETGTGSYDSIGVYQSRKINSTGTRFGARAGVQLLRLLVGVEPTYSIGTLKTDRADGQSFSDAYTQTNLHAFVGVYVTPQFRLWGGFSLWSEQKEIYSSNETTLSLTSAKVGLSYRIRNFAISMDYIQHHIARIKDSRDQEIDIGSNYSKTSMNQASLQFSYLF